MRDSGEDVLLPGIHFAHRETFPVVSLFMTSCSSCRINAVSAASSSGVSNKTQQIVVSSVLRCQIDQAAYQFRRTFRQLADDNTETSPLPQAALTSRRKNSHLIASNLSIKFMPASSFSYILPATKDSLTGAGFEPA